MRHLELPIVADEKLHVSGEYGQKKSSGMESIGIYTNIAFPFKLALEIR